MYVVAQNYKQTLELTRQPIRTMRLFLKKLIAAIILNANGENIAINNHVDYTSNPFMLRLMAQCIPMARKLLSTNK